MDHLAAEHDAAVALVVAAFATQLAPRLIDLGTPVFVSIGLIIFILGIG